MLIISSNRGLDYKVHIPDVPFKDKFISILEINGVPNFTKERVWPSHDIDLLINAFPSCVLISIFEELTMVNKDLFNSNDRNLKKIEFIRDKKGRLSGMLVSNGGVINMKYNK